ncbi:hypothetical protein BST61_g4926 [Cercospora zeina]
MPPPSVPASAAPSVSAVSSGASPALSACANLKAVSIDTLSDQGKNGGKSSGIVSVNPTVNPTGSANSGKASSTSSGTPFSTALVHRALTEAFGLRVRSSIGDITSSRSIYPTARSAGDSIPSDRLLARHEITTLRKVVRSPWMSNVYGRAAGSNANDNAGGAGGVPDANSSPPDTGDEGATGLPAATTPGVDGSEGTAMQDPNSLPDRAPQATGAGTDAYDTDVGSQAGAAANAPTPVGEYQPSNAASNETSGYAQSGAHGSGALGSAILEPLSSPTGAPTADEIDPSGNVKHQSNANPDVNGGSVDSPPAVAGQPLTGANSNDGGADGAGANSHGAPSGGSDEGTGNSGGSSYAANPPTSVPSGGGSDEGAVNSGGSSGAADEGAVNGGGSSYAADPPSSVPSSGGAHHSVKIGVTVPDPTDGDDQNAGSGGSSSAVAQSPSSGISGADANQDAHANTSQMNGAESNPPGGSGSGMGADTATEAGANEANGSETPQTGSGSTNAGQDIGEDGSGLSGSNSAPSNSPSAGDDKSAGPNVDDINAEDSSASTSPASSGSGAAANGFTGSGLDAGAGSPQGASNAAGAGTAARINTSPMAQAPKFAAGQKATVLIIPNSGHVGQSGAHDVNTILASGQPVYEASGEINEGGVFLVDDKPMLTFNPSRVAAGGPPAAAAAAAPAISVTPPDEDGDTSPATAAQMAGSDSTAPGQPITTHAPSSGQQNPAGEEADALAAPITSTMMRRSLEDRAPKKQKSGAAKSSSKPKSAAKTGAKSTTKPPASKPTTSAGWRGYAQQAANAAAGAYSSYKGTSQVSKVAKSSHHATASLTGAHALPTGSALDHQQEWSSGMAHGNTVTHDGTSPDQEGYGGVSPSGSSAGGDYGYEDSGSEYGATPPTTGEASGMGNDVSSGTDVSGSPSADYGNDGSDSPTPVGGSGDQVGPRAGEGSVDAAVEETA